MDTYHHHLGKHPDNTTAETHTVSLSKRRIFIFPEGPATPSGETILVT